MGAHLSNRHRAGRRPPRNEGLWSGVAADACGLGNYSKTPVAIANSEKPNSGTIAAG